MFAVSWFCLHQLWLLLVSLRCSWWCLVSFHWAFFSEPLLRGWVCLLRVVWVSIRPELRWMFRWDFYLLECLLNWNDNRICQHLTGGRCEHACLGVWFKSKDHFSIPSHLVAQSLFCFLFLIVLNFFFFPQWKDLGQGRTCSWQKGRFVAFAWSPVKSSWASLSCWSWKLPWKSVVSFTKMTMYKHYRWFCLFILK